MQGNAELRRLVELLVLGAETARRIADLRVVDRDEIHALAAQADGLAEALQTICDRSGRSPVDTN